MNTAQRRTLLAYSPCVRRAWHREFRECLAANLSGQGARESADRVAQIERERQRQSDDAAMGWPRGGATR